VVIERKVGIAWVYALCLFFWDWDFLDMLPTVLLSTLGIRGEADRLSGANRVKKVDLAGCQQALCFSNTKKELSACATIRSWPNHRRGSRLDNMVATVCNKVWPHEEVAHSFWEQFVGIRSKSAF
jgi:hypothetical protein